MGIEAECECRCAGETGTVKALLEADALILRGAIKRRFAREALRSVRAGDDGLSFQAGAEAVVLHLPQADAARWKQRLETAPPGLRDKLGLGGGAKAFVLGAVRDAALAAALDGARAGTAASAAMAVAEVDSADELRAALAAAAALPAGAPIWIVHGKGRNATFGEAPVREVMRGAGFIDTKVAAVSAERTGTRYGKRK